MCLNLAKYVFGVQGGKFLGFLLTSRGIEANLKKCFAILEIRSPSTLKEVQQLTEHIAAISKFLSKSIEKARPFFRLLKKQGSFEWTEECERAF